MGFSLIKILYQITLLSVSIVSIQYIWKPLYEHGVHLLTNSSFGDQVIQKVDELTGYNVLKEEMLTMWMISGFGGYMIMGLICGALDLLLPITYKTQQSRSYFTFTEWIQAISLSLFNLFVSSWIVSFPYSYLKRVYPSIDPELNNGEFILHVEIIKFTISVLVVEVWFYTTHYLLHQPPFYSFIHKIHHRFKAPVAVASMYAHPVEFVVGNLLGVVLGPMLTMCHPLTSYVWIHNALMSTGGSHSGYKMFYADFHDAHHQYFDYNFGIDGPLDKLFGTMWEGSDKWKQIEAKKGKKS